MDFQQITVDHTDSILSLSDFPVDCLKEILYHADPLTTFSLITTCKTIMSLSTMKFWKWKFTSTWSVEVRDERILDFPAFMKLFNFLNLRIKFDEAHLQRFAYKAFENQNLEGIDVLIVNSLENNDETAIKFTGNNLLISMGILTNVHRYNKICLNPQGFPRYLCGKTLVKDEYKEDVIEFLITERNNQFDSNKEAVSKILVSLKFDEIDGWSIYNNSLPYKLRLGVFTDNMLKSLCKTNHYTCQWVAKNRLDIVKKLPFSFCSYIDRISDAETVNAILDTNPDSFYIKRLVNPSNLRHHCFKDIKVDFDIDSPALFIQSVLTENLETFIVRKIENLSLTIKSMEWLLENKPDFKLVFAEKVCQDVFNFLSRKGPKTQAMKILFSNGYKLHLKGAGIILSNLEKFLIKYGNERTSIYLYEVLPNIGNKSKSSLVKLIEGKYYNTGYTPLSKILDSIDPGNLIRKRGRFSII